MRIASSLKKFIPVLFFYTAQPLQAQQAELTTGTVIYTTAGLETLLPKGTRLEVIGSGFRNAEGPVWWRDSTCLLFSDTRSQTLYKWSVSKGLSKFIEHAGYSGPLPYSEESGTNGLALNLAGDLIVCEHGNRRIAALNLHGRWGVQTLADAYNGLRLNSPNDVVVRRNGDIYFTDPPYGLPKKDADSAKQSRVNGVYLLRGGTTKLIVADLDYPNGLAFSPDEKALYVSVSSEISPRIMVYPVQGDGTVGKGRVFFDATALPKTHPKQTTDGLKVDRLGNLWASGPGGLLVIDARGSLLGRVGVNEAVTNCAWGDGGSVLYITAGSFLYRLQTGTGGTGF